MNNLKISFPQLANYIVPITFLLENILDVEIIKPNKITTKTIELGTKYSPDFVCTPFKYTLGTMIESLDMGANILIQPGGGCRYGYYHELQEKILKDLGYEFKLYNFVTAGKLNIKRVYKTAKKIDKKINVIKALYYLFLTKKMIKYMDKTDDCIRKNIGFEIEKGSFEKINDEMLYKFSKVKNPIELYFIYKKYFKLIKKIKTNKPKDCLKVGIIGELYTVMEPFSNYFLEKELASYNIEIKRFTNVNYLLFDNKKVIKKALKNTKEFQKYKMAADATTNVYWAKYLCLKNYDGIIHIKSSFCTPEISVMPILNKVCSKYNKPIIYFSFDSSTSEVGIKTRIEAFKDMIEMRR
ncbi:MAG: 2-hydroxyacyl-CoA dehydratase [Bacilli bacterium]|nr:2-hydroxyacyl-CoA dehydratase [Bacilli bacterium]